MAYVDPFHSYGADHLDNRARGHYHVNSRCRFGQMVKLHAYDAQGTGGYRFCKRCSVLIAKRKPWLK